MQRFRKKCKEQKFLTSGVKAHLGGLGGSEQSHLTIFSPLLHSPHICQVGMGGEKGGESCNSNHHQLSNLNTSRKVTLELSIFLIS